MARLEELEVLVREAVQAARKVSRSATFKAWADGWLSGKDRTPESAVKFTTKADHPAGKKAAWAAEAFAHAGKGLFHDACRQDAAQAISLAAA